MLNVGDLAPDFSLPSDRGDAVSLGSRKGRVTVLYFYPKDDTPGCTVEAQDFTRLAPAFAALGVEVFGVSKDSVARHCRFRDKYGLGVALLSDETLAVQRAYGAYGEKTLYGKKIEGTLRSTFVIDAEGRIAARWSPVKVPGHAAAVLASLTKGEPSEAPAAAPKRRARVQKSEP